MTEQKTPISTASLMTEKRTFPPSPEVVKRAHINAAQYQKMYDRSIKDPDGFWLEQAQTLDWFKKPTVSRKYTWNVDARAIKHTWFADGELNVSVNCLDRHLKTQEPPRRWPSCGRASRNRTCSKITYEQLHTEVCKFANVLKSQGVKKGDRVCDLHADDPGAAGGHAGLRAHRRDPLDRVRRVQRRVAGGPHQRLRVQDCWSPRTCRCAPASTFRLKAIADEALQEVAVRSRRSSSSSAARNRATCRRAATSGTTRRWPRPSAECEPEEMNAEDPLFILYTSGSTGKPKGVVHTTAGYLLHVAISHKYIFDIHDDDMYWCTADIGWVTGHSYIVYGPLANGATSMMFEGVPTYPDAGRFWQIVREVQGHRVLHRAHGDPLADAPGRRVAEQVQPRARCACWAPSASRSIPKPGSGTTR